MQFLCLSSDVDGRCVRPEKKLLTKQICKVLLFPAWLVPLPNLFLLRLLLSLHISNSLSSRLSKYLFETKKWRGDQPLSAPNSHTVKSKQCQNLRGKTFGVPRPFKSIKLSSQMNSGIASSKLLNALPQIMSREHTQFNLC